MGRIALSNVGISALRQLDAIPGEAESRDRLEADLYYERMEFTWPRLPEIPSPTWSRLD
jgi:hypothetical protein